MKKKLILYLLLIPALAFGQVNKKLIHFMMAGGGGGSSPASGVGQNIRIVSGLDTVRQNVTRDAVSESFVINVPAGHTGAWEIIENTTQTVVFSGSGLSGSFIPNFDQEEESGFGALPVGYKEYDLKITATRSPYTYTRTFTKIIRVSRPIFSEGGSDLVIDLTAIGAGTFSNPLGDASIAGNGTTNFAYDFDDVSRPNLKVTLKGTFNGRINIIGLRGTSGNPVIIQSPTSGQATINATNASQPYALQFTTAK